MNLLGAALYDPTGGAAVTKATTSLLAMTALDTTNLRIAFTVPAHGIVHVKLAGVHHGSTTTAQVLLGVLEGSTLRGRMAASPNLLQTAIATTQIKLEAEYTITGLTPGAAVNWDAAYGVEIVSSAGGAIKYGGPNDTTTNNAMGGFRFEVWDPRPMPTAAPGAANGVQICGSNAATTYSTLTSTGAFTVNGVSAVSQTGDAFARLGAPVGASISADVAGVQSDTNDIQTRIPAALVSGRMDSSVGAMAANVVTAASLAADAGGEIADAVWDEAIAGHLTAGSTGAQLNAAGAGGDPWATALPGAYGAGTAGQILGGRLDVASSTLATAANLAIVAGYLDTEIAAIKAKTDNLPAAPAATGDIPTAVTNAAAVWDRVLTGATHNIAGSAGRRLRQLDALTVHTGTATAGTSNSITLDGGASATTDIYDGNLVVIVAGTGTGQTRTIVEYIGATKKAFVDETWTIAPDNTSDFQIIAAAAVSVSHHGIAQAGAAGSITLSATTASSQDDIYKGQTINIRTGTGEGQARLITDYNGTTKVASVTPDWNIIPAAESSYVIRPVGASNIISVAGYVVTGAGTEGDPWGP